MTNKISPDQKQRDLALDPQKSFIVQAPAGSGKTEILSLRILSLLSIVEKPEQILAITFTKKAASEMLERVRHKLIAYSNPEPESEFQKLSWKLANDVVKRDKEKNWKLLENIDRLRIRTIDSFTNSLVRNTPLISGVGSGIDFTDDSDALFQETVDLMLEDYDSKPFLQEVLKHLDMRFDIFRDLMVEMLKKRQNWQDVIKRKVPSQQVFHESYERIANDYLKELSRQINKEEFKSIIWPLIRISHLDDLSIHNGFLNANDSDFVPEFSIEHIPFWKIVRDYFLTKEGKVRTRTREIPKIHTDNKYLEPFKELLAERKNDQDLVRALLNVCYLPDRFKSLIHDYEVFFVTLEFALEKLELVFANHSKIDFTESAIRALKALGEADDPTDLLLKIDNDIQHVLIDEFQDTNQMQKQLLEKICSGWQYGDGRSIFLVGDPMQSIYRFRQAEVGIFIDYATKAKKNNGLPPQEQKGVVGEVPLEFLNLSVNFRSNKNIIDWVNKTFTFKFPSKDDSAMGAISFTPSEAFKDESNEQCVLSYVYKKDIQSSYKQIVDLVKKALSENADSSKPVGILVKYRSHLEDLVKHLIAEGVPVRAIEMVPLGNTEEIMDLVQCIRALSHKGDRLAWLSTLRSPLCGLSLNTLTKIFESRKKLSPPEALREVLLDKNFKASVDEDEFARLFYVSDILLRNHLNYSNLAFPHFVASVWEDLGGNKIYSDAAQQSNLKRVFELLEDSAPYGDFNLEDFERKLSKLYAQDIVQGPVVEVMTMHAAKGLEFEEVFLFGLNKKAQNSKSSLIEFENEGSNFLVSYITETATGTQDDLYELISKRNKEREAYETMRLIYVACTRAKKKLHLFLNITNDKNEAVKNSVAGMLDLVHDFEIKTEIYKNESEEESEDNIEESEVEYIDNSQIRRIVFNELKAPTSESSSIANLAVRETKAWQFDDQFMACVGHVVHMWLESMGKDRLEGWTLEKIKNSRGLVQNHLFALGLPNVALTRAITRVIKLLCKAYEDENAHWLLTHANAIQEWSLYDEIATEKRFDVVVDNGDHWLLVDFKTNLPHEEEEIEDFIKRMIRIYTSQLNQYAEYLKSFDNRPVVKKLFILHTCDFIDI